MIYTENKIIRHHKFLHTYSDSFYIKSDEDGEVYLDAYDVYGSTRTYTETDIPLPEEAKP